MASKDLDRLLALLSTSDHQHAVPLFDVVVKDPGAAGPILQELVYVAANHDDPQLRTPHGLITMVAGRDLLLLTRPPGGLGLLRFLVLYNFGLQKRGFDPTVGNAMVRSVPSAGVEELGDAYRKAIYGGLTDQAASVLGRLATDHGLEASAHLSLRSALGDLGRLGHNFVTAAAYVAAADVVGSRRSLVPLMNLGRLQASALQGVPGIKIPEEQPAKEEASVEALGEFVTAGAFDRVEAVLQALVAAGKADDAYRPLLIATSADPGFLGHSLSLVHAARVASRYLTPAENAWLAWKLYRTLTTRFGYPEFLRLGEPQALDPRGVLNALESTLQYRSPPAERTVRQALETGLPLDEILATIVDAYGRWTVGEKEHTISYLSAALQTTRFLGREEALLPLTIALGRLPF